MKPTHAEVRHALAYQNNLIAVDPVHHRIVLTLCEEWIENHTLSWAGGALRGPTRFVEATQRYEIPQPIGEYGSPTITGRDWIERRGAVPWVATFRPGAVHPSVRAFPTEAEARAWLEEQAREAGYEATR